VQADEPAVVMHTAGGRRKRLGVGGKAVQVSRVTDCQGVQWFLMFLTRLSGDV